MEERLYDLIFICLPTTPEEEIAKIIATLEQVIAERGGKVEKIDKWGIRKMAYRVAKQREGYYVVMSIRGSQPDMIKERRRTERHSFNRFARIQAEMAGASRDCLIVDMSELGVRLHSEYPELPGEFTLVIADAARRAELLPDQHDHEFHVPVQQPGAVER